MIRGRWMRAVTDRRTCIRRRLTAWRIREFASPICMRPPPFARPPPRRFADRSHSHPRRGAGKRSLHQGQAGMPAAEITLAELLRDNGYATGHIGKWHLGYTPETMPNGQGFDYSFGHMGGASTTTVTSFTGTVPIVMTCGSKVGKSGGMENTLGISWSRSAKAS